MCIKNFKLCILQAQNKTSDTPMLNYYLLAIFSTSTSCRLVNKTDITRTIYYTFAVSCRGKQSWTVFG